MSANQEGTQQQQDLEKKGREGDGIFIVVKSLLHDKTIA
jgi:hypothetical protein